MPTVFWILIGAVLLAFCAGGKKKNTSQKGPYRIDRPHVIDPDDYECSVCHRWFRKDQMSCPFCGTKFVKHVTDEEEFIFVEDEFEAWDEEDNE